MSQELETYSLAVTAYVAAITRARQISEIINRGASALRNWEQVRVIGADGEFPDAIGTAGYSDSHLKATEWPCAQQIADALLNYHRTRQEVERAFAGIPQHLQNAVRNPDSVTPAR